MYIPTKEGQQVYDVYSSLIHTIPEKGIPRYYISNESVLGLKRNDTDPTKTQHDLLQSLRMEGALLAQEDAVELDERKKIIFVNTFAPSPHTVFRVPYESMEPIWRDNAERLGITVPQSTPLVRGAESSDTQVIPPSYVPLDTLVWMMLEESVEENGQWQTRLRPIDLGDLCSPPGDEPMIDQYRLGLQNNPAKLEEVFKVYFKRSELNASVITDLFNSVIRPAYANDPHESLFLPEATDNDILQGVANGYYRGDQVKLLDQYEYDHLGKGTQSSATLHNRNTLHASLALLKKIAQMNSGTVDDVIATLKRKEQFFGDDLVFEPVYQKDTESGKKVRSDLLKHVPITDLIKIIDPYSSIAYGLTEKWLEERANDPQYFAGYDIKSYNDHQADDDGVSSTQGIEISIPYVEGEEQAVAVQTKMKASMLIGQVFYPLWEDVKRYTKKKIVMSHDERAAEMSRIQDKYQIPETMVTAIQSLLPTERQLVNLLATESDHEKQEKIARTLARYDRKKRLLLQQKKALEAKIDSDNGYADDLVDLLYISHALQIYDSVDGEVVNKGYNISGVPSFVLTHNWDHENKIFSMKIDWTLSMKGLSEHRLRALLKRAEAKV